MKEEPDIFFNTTIGTAKTKHVSLPRLKPSRWIMIIQSILQVGVNSADSTEFTGPVEYLKTMTRVSTFFHCHCCWQDVLHAFFIFH